MNEITGQPPQAPPGGFPEGNPWEQRDRLGFGTAFVENIKLFITSPAEAFARTRRSGDLASPLIFAVAISWIGILIGQIWSMMFGGSMLSMLPPELQDQAGMYMASSFSSLMFAAVIAPFATAVGLFIWSGILHLCLAMVGGTSKSSSGFEGTFRVVSYSTVTQLANLIPIVGGMVAFVWAIVLSVMGLSDLHETTQGKALAAVLIPIFVCCACVVLFFVVMGVGLAGLAAQS